MVGWDHQLNGLEFEQALGVGDGQGSLASCGPQGHKKSYMIDWTELWRDRERHYIMIKTSIQEDITTINRYVPDLGAPQYKRQILTAIKGEINSNTIIGETLKSIFISGQIISIENQ